MRLMSIGQDLKIVPLMKIYLNPVFMKMKDIYGHICIKERRDFSVRRKHN